MATSRRPNKQTPTQRELRDRVLELLSEVQALEALTRSDVNFGELYVEINKISHETLPKVVESANQLF